MGSVDQDYELLRLDSSVRLDNDEVGFYFELGEGDVATLALQGTDRDIKVSDADGNEYASTTTDVGRKQVWLGSPFQESDVILKGMPQPVILTVEVGEYDDPFGQRVTELSLTGPRQDADSRVADHLLIPFSLLQTEYLKISKKDGRPRKTSGKLKEAVASYYVPPNQLGTVALIQPENVFVLAICDRLGNVYDISNSTVHLKPGIGGGSEGVYLIVTRSPFSNESDIKYELNFIDDFSQLK